MLCVGCRSNSAQPGVSAAADVCSARGGTLGRGFGADLQRELSGRAPAQGVEQSCRRGHPHTQPAAQPHQVSIYKYFPVKTYF